MTLEVLSHLGADNTYWGDVDGRAHIPRSIPSTIFDKETPIIPVDHRDLSCGDPFSVE